MIFGAKNERGEPTWKLALEGRRTITRRIKPLSVGKNFAIQPGRGKFAVCRAVVVSCMNYRDWIKSQSKPGHLTLLGLKFFNKEAKKEGFEKWGNLVNWFKERGQDIEDMFRIEFKRV